MDPFFIALGLAIMYPSLAGLLLVLWVAWLFGLRWEHIKNMNRWVKVTLVAIYAVLNPGGFVFIAFFVGLWMLAKKARAQRT